jgi:hypothetical protein
MRLQNQPEVLFMDELELTGKGGGGGLTVATSLQLRPTA